MNATKHRKLMTILTKLGKDEEERHEMIYAWTQGRTNSSKELYDSEIDNLLWKLQNDFTFTKNINPLLEIERRNKRAAVLSIANRVGMFPDGSDDFTQFNRFMKNKSILKKKLTSYNLEELDALIAQFKTIQRNYMASAQTPGTKAYDREHGFPGVGSN